MDMETPETLEELGHILSDKFGQKFHDDFFSADESDIGEKTVVFVNGRSANFLGRLKAKLQDGDNVLIFPVVAGG